MFKSIKLLTIFVLCTVMFTNDNNIIAQSSIKSVKIGGQKWMAKNLDVTHFRNGEEIPEAKSNEDWDRLGIEGKPAWCNYNNNPQNGKKYGKLYNWFAVNDRRGLAPEGWHIPTIAEFRTLQTSVGNNRSALIGKGLGHFYYGTNSSGFSALPVGYRDFNGDFRDLGFTTFFRSSTGLNEMSAYSIIVPGSNELGSKDNDIFFGSYGTGSGFSVRCLKD